MPQGVAKKKKEEEKKKINHQAQPEALISEFRNNQLKARMVQGLSWAKQMLSLSLSLSLFLQFNVKVLICALRSKRLDKY